METTKDDAVEKTKAFAVEKTKAFAVEKTKYDAVETTKYDAVETTKAFAAETTKAFAVRALDCAQYGAETLALKEAAFPMEAILARGIRGQRTRSTASAGG